MTKTFNPALAHLLRCPFGGDSLTLSIFEGDMTGVQTGILVARDSLYGYPIVNGTPVLLNAAAHTFHAFFTRWGSDSRFPSHVLPPPMSLDQSSEIKHYELNGIEIIDSDSFESARRATSLSLIPDDTESLLEIGTGPGVFLSQLEQLHPNITVMGIERSSASIRAARCSASIYQADADRLPFPDQSFQCLVSMKTLEHLPCGVYEAALQEMMRVAEKHIVINVPYNERRLQAICPSCDCVFNPSYHMRSFSDQALDNLFPGFVVVKRIEQPRFVNVVSALASPFRRRVFDGFVDYGLCPQCGYRKPHETTPSQGKSRPAITRNIVRRIASTLPKVATRGDVILLYKRHGG